MTDYERELEKKFGWTQEAGGLSIVTNNSLVCKDCKHRNKKPHITAHCAMFISGKPNSVIYGGDCSAHERE